MSIISATQDAIESLRQKARDWALRVRELYYMEVPPELVERKKVLLTRAKYIKSVLETVFGTLDELKDVQLGLGPLPIIGGVAVAGAMAAITYWLADYGKFKLEVEAKQQFHNQVNKIVGENPGLTYEQAYNVVYNASKNVGSGGSIFEKFIGDPKAILLPIGFGFILLQYFLRNK